MNISESLSAAIESWEHDREVEIGKARLEIDAIAASVPGPAIAADPNVNRLLHQLTAKVDLLGQLSDLDGKMLGTLLAEVDAG